MATEAAGEGINLQFCHIDCILRDYYAGKLGDQDLESRLLRDVSEERFRTICKTALEGLATKQLNLEMLVERRARVQERRVVPETIARFMVEAAPLASFALTPHAPLLHTFDPGLTPSRLRRFEQQADWRFPRLSNRYPRLSTDRAVAESHSLQSVTPGHPLLEARQGPLQHNLFRHGMNLWDLATAAVDSN